jgi:hypothetical protein
VHLFDKERSELLNTIFKVADETALMLKPYESYSICMAVKSVIKLNGAIAEVGVYKGGSAKLICEFKGEKTLHLFDTFDGLPELNQYDTSNEFHKGQFSNTSLENIQNLLRKYPNVFIHKGYFPNTAEIIKKQEFSFVHLDVDLHKTTKDALDFFYPRLQKGGIIISHDYVNADGVRKAFDDFFSSKSEPIIVISDSQCMIIKC